MNLCIISLSFVLLFCIIRNSNSNSMSLSDTRNSSSSGSSSVPIKKKRIRLSSVSERPSKISSKKVTVTEDVAMEGVGEAAAAALDNSSTCLSSSNSTCVQAELIPDILNCASNSDEIRYLDSLSAIERNVCLIAKEHLQSSFDLSRSSGFISWKRENL